VLRAVSPAVAAGNLAQPWAAAGNWKRELPVLLPAEVVAHSEWVSVERLELEPLVLVQLVKKERARVAGWKKD
jgi:hypothetical protein